MAGLGDEGATRLFQRCQRGDATAWAELVDRYQRLVYSVAKRSGLADDDAEDVFQFTFLSLYKSLDRIDDPESLPKWLGVTAARESYRLKRLSSRTGSLPDDRSLEDVLADDDDDAEREAVRSVQAEFLKRAADDLPQRCRDLVDHLYFRESSYQEISAAVGIPIGAIGPTRARCLEKLRRILENRGFFADEAYLKDAVAPSSLS